MLPAAYGYQELEKEHPPKSLATFLLGSGDPESDETIGLYTFNDGS